MNLCKMISKLMNKNIKPKVNLNFKKSDRKKAERYIIGFVTWV